MPAALAELWVVARLAPDGATLAVCGHARSSSSSNTVTSRIVQVTNRTHRESETVPILMKRYLNLNLLRPAAAAEHVEQRQRPQAAELLCLLHLRDCGSW